MPAISATPKGLGRVAFRIGQERERQVMLLREAFLRLRSIDAQAHDFHAPFLQHRKAVAQAAGLFRAAGSLRPRIKIDEGETGSVEIAEMDRITFHVENKRVGRVRPTSSGLPSAARPSQVKKLTSQN